MLWGGGFKLLISSPNKRGLRNTEGKTDSPGCNSPAPVNVHPAGSGGKLVSYRDHVRRSVSGEPTASHLHPLLWSIAAALSGMQVF